MTAPDRTATIVDVGGRWILHWPEGMLTVEISRQLLEQIVADHNDRTAA